MIPFHVQGAHFVTASVSWDDSEKGKIFLGFGETQVVRCLQGVPLRTIDNVISLFC